MKKIYPVLMLLAATTLSKAAIVVISVTSNQFTPANVTVTVGDVVRFSFQQGYHNATSANVANGVPSGAADINSGSASSVNPRTYDYTVTTIGNYNYICEIHANPAGGGIFTGMVAAFTATAPLPVLLKDFSVAVNPEKKPSITWSTVTEQNVADFTVRRSSDGFKFQDIGKVVAIGNSTTQQDYSLIDNTLSQKDKYVYYALAITDKDGKQTLSPTKNYKNPTSTAKIVMSISPNPISRPGHLMIQFNAEKTGDLFVKVYNNAGQMVQETKMSAFEGLNNGHVHVCDLSAGIYTLQFTLDGVKESKRIVVQ